MDILLLTRYFPPEIGTAASLFHEMSRTLAKRGHRVVVVTSFPWYNLDKAPERYARGLFMRERMDGFEVIRTRFPLFGPRGLKLALGHVTAPMASFLGGFFAGRADVVFVYSPPLFMGMSGWLTGLFKKAPFVLGVQDLHPQCYVDQGVLRNRALIRILEAMERFCYRKASLVTVHSDGNRDHVVLGKGTPGEKVKVVPNWVDTDGVRPLPRDNWFSRRHGLNGRFVVGYAGTLGMSQGLMNVVLAADMLKDRDDMEFFIVGDGIEKKGMEAMARSLGLGNIRFLGMQPKEVYPYVIASFDAGLVTLNKRVTTPVVPSKILSLMAAERCVLASLPLEGDAARLIAEAGCGVCVGPDDPSGLALAAARLSGDREGLRKFGERGRAYVEGHFSLDKAAGRMEAVFSEARGNGRKTVAGYDLGLKCNGAPSPEE